MAQVILVVGAPGSGKTTYVNERRGWGEAVIDLDALFVAISGEPWYHKPASLMGVVLAARDGALQKVRLDKNLVRAWVISSTGDSGKIVRLQASLKAELVVMDTPRGICKMRVGNDPRRKGMDLTDIYAAVDRWFEDRSRW